MEHLIQFVINHWMLWLSLVFIVSLLIFEETGSLFSGVAMISTTKAVDMINHDSTLIIDLRAKPEFMANHLLNSINIPFADFDKSLNKLTQHKQKSVILICAMGQNAKKPVVTLSKQGFSHVYVMRGGIAAWQRDNLPLTKK